MPHLLEELRALPGRNPPASQADLDMLAEALGSEPPSSVALLYRDHAGIKDGHRLPLRLLPPAEAVRTNTELRASWLRLDPSIAVFWTDDNSNYAGVFVHGDLSGRVCLIDHEEPVDWPRYRSVDSLCHRIVEAWRHGQDWYEMPTDYPAVVAALDPLVGQDRLLARAYLARYAENPEDEHCQHLAFHALHLLPPDETTLLLPLLQSSDMWLQARACEVLGLVALPPRPRASTLLPCTALATGRSRPSSRSSASTIGTPPGCFATCGVFSATVSTRTFDDAALRSEVFHCTA